MSPVLDYSVKWSIFAAVYGEGGGTSSVRL